MKKRRILIAILFILAVACSMQMVVAGVSSETCDHLYVATGLYYQENYSMVNTDYHSYDRYEWMECIYCDDVYGSYRGTYTEGHTEYSYVDWYYNEWTLFTCCSVCGGTLHVSSYDP